MKKLFDMCVITGTYPQNGQTKNHYKNIGAIYKNDKGNSFAVIKAHFNPAGIHRKEGSECIFVSLFPPKDKDSTSSHDPARSSEYQSQHWDGNTQDSGYDNDSSDNIPF